MAPIRRQLDLRISGYTPADEATEENVLGQIWLSEPELTVLADHHHGHDSYFLLHDGSMTWDIPGSPQLLAVHLTRHPPTRTFRYTSERLPLIALAQQWLIARGCPPAALHIHAEDQGPTPADAQTTALEDKLRGAAGRYELLDHYTGEYSQPETTVLLRDTHPSSAGAPYRVFVEQADLDAFTYTLREGAFPTEQAARDWLHDRDTPLPPAIATARPPAVQATRPPTPPTEPPRPGGRHR